MSILSDNIRYLRAQKQFSQQKIADDLIITRGRYSKYEDGASDPPLDILLRISHYFHVSIDILLSVNMNLIPSKDLIKLEGNRLLLPIMVDSNGENLIEIVTQKAKAGYISGYADPEYVINLPYITLPFLGSGKHRAFPVEGDSMPPHEDGSLIVAKYIETIDELVDSKTYILITKDDGIVYKRLKKKDRNSLLLESDNALYKPYDVEFSQIVEIWEFEYNIGKNDNKVELSDFNNITEVLLELKREILELKNSII